MNRNGFFSNLLHQMGCLNIFFRDLDYSFSIYAHFPFIESLTQIHSDVQLRCNFIRNKLKNIDVSSFEMPSKLFFMCITAHSLYNFSLVEKK